MISHSFTKRVRYGETDKMGFLYYGRYADYMEIGRVEWLRNLGVSYRMMEDEMNIWLPVKNMEMRYVRSVHYDELVTVITTLRTLPKEEIIFHFEFKNEAGKLIAGGRVKLVFMDAVTKRVIRIPDLLMEKLLPHFKDGNN